MSKQTKTSLLIGGCILQVLILLGIIVGINGICRGGEIYVMKATGYDPYDLLRGRYIQVRLCEQSLPLKANEEMPLHDTDQTVYAVFDRVVGKLAYCTFHKPAKENYLKADSWHKVDGEESRLQCCFKTEEYYVNEKVAGDLEKKISASEDVYLKIQVNKGIYLVKKLVVDGESY